MPAEDFVFGNEDVTVTVAVEVNEFEVWVAGIKIRERVKWAERFPAGPLGALVEAAHGTFHCDDIGLAVTGEVHELCMAREANGGLGSDEFDRREAGSGFFRTVAVG